MQYTLPRDLFDELAKNTGKESAEKFAGAIENFLKIIQKESQKEIIEKKENLKAEIYNELRNELATKEFVRAEINLVKAEINSVRGEINSVRGEINSVRSELEVIKAEIKQNNFFLKILIGISIFGLTIFNPNFVKIIEKIFK